MQTTPERVGTLLELLVNPSRVWGNEMSEDLRQRGYLAADGALRGDRVGPYEGFNIGNSTIRQLKAVGAVQDKLYASPTAKPDGLVVDRRDPEHPRPILVVEYKDRGELGTEARRTTVFNKVAEVYNGQLDCSLAVVSDTVSTFWLLVDPQAATWRAIGREDGYPLDAPVDLASVDGREALAELISRLQTELDPATASLVPLASVDPTRLADQTWQMLWLASGDSPETCLASFVEVLLFKFLSDLGLLGVSPSGVKVDFESVRTLSTDQALPRYVEETRPAIERLFPPGSDGVSVVGGLSLDPANRDHRSIFLSVLARFQAFGNLRRIDPEFKSRIFERFLKKSISQKNWGQFFTPRNVVKAIVEMSGVESLPPGASVADPAAGVGGFLLEPLVHKRAHDFRDPAAAPLTYRGYDRDAKTVRLAKANMLIHLSEAIERDPAGAAARLAPILNDTFTSMADSQVGSLRLAPRAQWDLVMTNPPYVVAGSTSQRKAIGRDPRLAAYYDVSGSGVENLFVQEIVNGLKPGGRALVVLPDGLLARHSEESLKRRILRDCVLEAVISLPKDTFYSTPKKTYIVSLRKKQVSGVEQVSPVFTYIVGRVGETLDAKRFVIPENDLVDMAQQFRLFSGYPELYQAPSAPGNRVRVRDFERFHPESHWLVDRWWGEDELAALPEHEARASISPRELAERLTEVSGTVSDLAAALVEQADSQAPQETRAVSLGDGRYFRLSIGKRVLKGELFGKAAGDVPLYSANVVEPFGYLDESNLADFDAPSVLFGIDGDFTLAFKEAGTEFAITDHCGRIEILVDDLDPSFCRAAIALARAEAFDRTLRPSLQRMRALTVSVPLAPDGSFDVEAQRALGSAYDQITSTLREVAEAFGGLAGLEPELRLPASAPEPPPA
ncbi:N-6 DNA methylase [Geodermatophilaceae bacterium NBWT11]|nr:N-6 DNA methylase [Geodermatophilaceae bacterium NBWT11]